MSYYEDKLSKWYISANNKHSTFPNQIKDEALKQQTETVIETKTYDSSFDTRFNFDVKGKSEQFSVWVDEDPKRNKLYRLTPGEHSSTPPSSDTTTGTGNKPKFQSGYFKAGTEDFVPLDEYKKRNKENFNIRRMPAKEMGQTWGIFQENGKEVIKVWIGEYVKPAS